LPIVPGVKTILIVVLSLGWMLVCVIVLFVVEIVVLDCICTSVLLVHFDMVGKLDIFVPLLVLCVLRLGLF
jgi:hypothetical protein